MTEKVLLAAIKSVSLQMMPAKPANSAAGHGGKWRKMSDFVVTLASFVVMMTQYGGLWRGGKWRKMSDFVMTMAGFVVMMTQYGSL